jgi:hypothetical protein
LPDVALRAIRASISADVFPLLCPIRRWLGKVPELLHIAVRKRAARSFSPRPPLAFGRHLISAFAERRRSRVRFRSTKS